MSRGVILFNISIVQLNLVVTRNPEMLSSAIISHKILIFSFPILKLFRNESLAYRKRSEYDDASKICFIMGQSNSISLIALVTTPLGIREIG